MRYTEEASHLREEHNYPGENHFVMDRGCFTYDQETTNPEVLSFIGTNDTTSGFESRYEAGDEKFAIKAEHRNGMIRVELVIPENCRYNRFNISIPVEKGLHYYGCGETHHALDLRGHRSVHRGALQQAHRTYA